MVQVLVAPHPVLRQPAKPVTVITKKLLDLIDDMAVTLAAAKNPEGVGLAAPQVGVSLRLFIIKPTPKSQVQVFINPEILKFSQRQQRGDTPKGIYEGCLSVPHHYSPISRSMAVTLKYQTINSSAQKESVLIDQTGTFSGLPAHIIQHEVDHLNGILFVDRVLEQNSKLYKIQGKKWEELNL